MSIIINLLHYNKKRMTLSNIYYCWGKFDNIPYYGIFNIMNRDFIRIAHLSDLHFTSEETNNAYYEAVKNDLSNLKPDLIAVTGDIADNMDLDLSDIDIYKSFQSTKKFLENLCNLCKLDPKYRLFIVPGNHDYRCKGVFNFKWKFYPQKFKEIFKDYFRTEYIEDLNLIVGCFNSNTTKKKINFSTGEVLVMEFNNFNENMNKWKRDAPEKVAKAKKIALLHHHPMPIYRAEAKGGLFDKEEFLLLKNSGTFMKEMIKNGIRLIFHGHKHHRGVSKASFPIDSDIFGNIGVISAASIRKDTDGEYSYNVVDYYDNGIVTVDFRVRRGEATYESEKAPPLILFNDEEARFLYFHDLKSRVSTIAKRVIYTCEISKDTGDLRSHTIFENWISNQEKPLEKIDAQIISESGMFTKPPKYTVTHPQFGQKIEWKPLGSPDTSGCQKAEIIFAPPLNKKPISAELIRNIPNAFFFTKEDRLAVTKTGSAKESVSVELKSYTAEQIIFQVQFPPGFIPKVPRVEVTDLHDNLQLEEQQYCQKQFNFSEMLNNAILPVDFPLSQRRYKIVWDLPSESYIKNKNISQSDLAKATEIKKNLLSLKPSDSDDGKIKFCLENIYNEIISTKYLFSEENQGGYLEICIAAYDKSIGRLRYVAFFCPKINKSSSCSIWERKIIKGQQISGLALRRNEPAKKFTTEPSRVNTYIRKPDCQCFDNKYYTAIVAFPLTFPQKTGNIVGIFEIASCSNNSGLFKLDELSINPFYDTVRTRFFKFICEAINIKLDF